MSTAQTNADLMRLGAELAQVRREIARDEARLDSLANQLDEEPNNQQLLEDKRRLQMNVAGLRKRADRTNRELVALRARTEQSVIDLTDEPATVQPKPEPRPMFIDIDPTPVAAARAEDVRIAATAPTPAHQLAQPLAAELRVSEIQERVAQHEQLLADNDAREHLLYDDKPSAIHPALLDSVWAESGKVALAQSIAGVSVVVDTALGTTDLDPVVLPRLRDGYDAHIALIHEYASPLLLDASTSYEQGDEFGIGDTFNFPRTRPTDGDDSLALREFQHRFVFTPNRYDAALSLQAIKAQSTPLAEFDVIALGAAERDRRFESGETGALFDQLRRTLDNESLVLPALFHNLDAQQSGARVRTERVNVPFASIELKDLATFRDEVVVTRYRRLESYGDFKLSQRVVVESTARSDDETTRLRPPTANTSLFPDELLIGPKDPDDVDDDNEVPEVVGTAPADRATETKRLMALADIEQALAEFDGTEYGMLRTQSASLRRAGPYYVVDDVRQYEFADPLGSLGRALGLRRVVDASLEARLQRHVVTPLRADQRTRMTFTDRLAAMRQAAPEEVVVPELAFAPMHELERRGLKRVADDSIGSGEPRTVVVLQQIEEEDEVRTAARQRRKRRLVLRSAPVPEVQPPVPTEPGRLPVGRGTGLGGTVRPGDVGRDRPADEEGEFLFDVMTGARMLQETMALLHSAAKRKASAVDDEPEEEEVDDDEEIRALRERFKEERRLEKLAEKEAEEIGDEEDEDLLREYDDELAAGAHVVRQSPALFERGRESGYFGPTIGVPMSATQTRLLRAIEESAKQGWRAAARIILLAAVYYKLVPQLYTTEFPEEAVNWLVATLRLLRARVDVATELYNSNVTSAFAKLRRVLEEREEVSEESDDAERDQMLADAGINTAVLPPVLVVDTDATIGQFAEEGGVSGATDSFSALDRLTVALVYATHQVRPRSARDLIGAVEFARTITEDDVGLAAESYPSFDTYAASGETVDALMQIMGDERAMATSRAYRTLASAPQSGSSLPVLYDEALQADELRAGILLARAVYARLERGERNDVNYVYLPLPPAEGVAAIERAVSLYTTLHGTNGSLDTARVIDLATARVRDRRALSERILLDQCAAPTYTAAAQHYANEHFAPHGTRLDLVYGARDRTTQPFAVYRNNQISLTDTLRSLLSTDWLGSGRVFIDSLATLDGVDDWLPFYNVLAPRRVALWCTQTADSITAAGQSGVVDITQTELGDLLRTAGTNIDGILAGASADDSDATLVSLFNQYSAALDTLGSALRKWGAQAARRPLTVQSIATFLVDAAALLRNDERLVYINKRDLALERRTSIPFPAFECEPETDSERRVLAELWYNVAQRLDWFALGYLNIPFNDSRERELARTEGVDAAERYSTFAHIYRRLAGGTKRENELRFLIAREVGNVQSGRTLWFEEAFIHSNPARFGELVRDELKLLVQWLKTNQRIAADDYSEALGRLRILDGGDTIEFNGADVATDDERVRTLDPRTAALVDRARGLARRLTSEKSTSGVAVELPYANHKQITVQALELARRLYTTVNEADAFPRRRYTTMAARRTDVTALLAYTRRALNEENFETVESRVAQPDSDVRTPEEWLADIAAVRASMLAERQRAAERTVAAGKQTDEERDHKEALTRLREAVKKIDITLTIVAGRAQLGALIEIEEKIEEKTARRFRILDAFVEVVRADARSARVPTRVEMVAEVDRVVGDDGDPALREALIELFAASVERRRERVERGVEISEHAPMEAVNLINLAFQENPVFSADIATSLKPVRRAVADYRAALEAMEQAVRAEPVDEPIEMGDPRDLRGVLTQLLELYEREADRLQLEQFVTSANMRPAIEFSRDVGSIPSLYVALLLPAAIERARIRLLTNGAPELRDGVYELATRGDVPQALRVAELVRRYCFYGQVPLRRTESNVFDDYSALLRRAEPAPGAWSLGAMHSPLINDDDPEQRLAPAAVDVATYTEQLYTLGNGLHHRLPFGPDLHLSVLWVRVMRLYMQYHRVRDVTQGLPVLAALSSLRVLYLSAQQLPFRRELTREIAELPLATDRCQLYLALMFAPPEALMLDTLPRRVAARLDIAEWRQRAANSFLPLIEEMRPIDVRLLTSLVTGFDYSTLRRRERRDQFNPERFNDPSGEAPSDNDDDDKSVEDDGAVQHDGRDATQRLDSRYVHRRAVATKEALVDAYYRIVIDTMYTVLPTDVRLITELATRRQQRAPDAAQLEIVYQIVRARAGDTRPMPTRERQYAELIAESGFERRVDTTGVPVRRIANLSAVVAQRVASGDRSLVTRDKMLAIYRLLVRDARLETSAKRRAVGRQSVPVLMRKVIFEPVGAVHAQSTGAQIYEFSDMDRGRGYASAERALLSASVRHRFYERELERGETEQTAETVLTSRILRTHREPAWHLVPRAALVGAMQVLSLGNNPVRQSIMMAALETVSKKLDLAQHLWHNDSAETPSRNDRFVTAAVQTPTPALETTPEPVTPPPPPPPVVAEESAPLTGLVQIEASDNVDSERWKRMIERNVGRLLLGAAAPIDVVQSFAVLALSIEPPTIKTQRLLVYESQQLAANAEDEGELATAFIGQRLRPVIEALRALFEQRLDVGGASELFSEGSLTAQREEIMTEARAQLQGIEGMANLFWLLARTEARRRARWRDVVTRRTDITSAELTGIRSLVDDDEKMSEEEADMAKRTVVRFYAYFSALFYNAVDESLRRQTAARTTPKRIIEDYVKEERKKSPTLDGQAAGAAAFLARQESSDRKRVVTERRDLERYVPVYVLLESLFFVPGARAGRDIMQTNQYHPLLPLLLAPAARRAVLRLQSAPDSTTSEKLTLTSLAGPLYPGSASFTPSEARAAAIATPFSEDNVLLLHEFVPSLTQPRAKPNYTIVNRVVGPDGDLSFDAPPTIDTLMRRIVGTPLDQPSMPMIRFTKASGATDE